MKRKSIIIITILLWIFYLTGLIQADEGKTEEIKISNKIITIGDIQGLRPVTLSSKPGTAVIWVNHSRFPVEILFLDKKVTLACGSPVNFIVGKDGAYESNKIPSGGTASLCFIEKGKYEYKIKALTTFYVGRMKRNFQGTISIQ